MSVIWSGVTEEGAVVPVQVTAEGKVVAVGDGPEGDYLKLTGGNLTGDLTVNEQITLATNGSATFASNVTTDGVFNLRNNNESANISLDGSANEFRFNTLYSNDVVFRFATTGSSASLAEKIRFKQDGSAQFAGAVAAAKIELKASGEVKSRVRFLCQKETNADYYFAGINASGDTKFVVGADGSGTFGGDVVIGSRGTQWLIRESNGVAMLIEQTRRGIEPRTPEKVRDLPNELDLIETALNEVMAKLKMVPPAGWPVWDGQDEVTSDNDNA